MSLIVQIGQCGNQLGSRIIDDLYNQCKDWKSDTTEFSANAFFTRSKDNQAVPHVISIDMEPKVIEAMMTVKRDYSYCKELSIFKQEGSGNNWAYGYFFHGESIKDRLKECMLLALRKFEGIRNVVIIHSLGGGTGSGLGSFILETLKDNFPSFLYYNVVVLPKSGGEVILQNYNAVLTLSKLDENSDGIIILENDKAVEVCQNVLLKKNIELDCLNEIMSKQIVSALLSLSTDDSVGFNFSELVSHKLIPVPRFKLLSSRFIPTTDTTTRSFLNDSWNGLLLRMQQMLLTGSTEGLINWHVKLHKTNTSVPVKVIHVKGLNNDKAKEEIKSKDLRSKQFKMKQHEEGTNYAGQVPSLCKMIALHVESNGSLKSFPEEFNENPDFVFQDPDWYYPKYKVPLFSLHNSCLTRVTGTVPVLQKS